MALSTAPILSPLSSALSLSSSNFIIPDSSTFHGIDTSIRTVKRNSRYRAVTIAQNDKDKPTKLVTFLGKGGSGKTTSAIFAAQHYAMEGLKTCLVIQSQDPTADHLLNCKIGTSPIKCNNNLSAVRLQTTKMLIEPLNRMKEADAHLNLTQGTLEGVVGEELGVLPGMDSIFSMLALGRILGFLRNTSQGRGQQDEFDIVVLDGISTEEVIRMIGATSKARLYLKYLRKLAEKTDLGRLAGPSLLRLIDEALSFSSGGANANVQLSSEVWDHLEKTLERGSAFFQKLQKFSCYIVMNQDSQLSVMSALRYWGCAIQAGVQVSGAFAFASPNAELTATAKDFSPLPFASIPHLSMSAHPNWNEVLVNAQSQDARQLLNLMSKQTSIFPPVTFDPGNKSITLFMPGFDKSEIKLFQFRGGSELLVEAGDQRRVIQLPSQIQGKVGGAKFIDRNLVITMR
ncbi:ATPase GET3D, chloroplastic-like [Coffea arabica]|uniref:ATPase GET3D, chloroplastic-like n=1 Tax=Coffea arabica TaxID=13443 RepID=A0ABM4WBQ1_COFAR|nr:uncharacterized protein At1g26090, chloroplastic isoform X1 [Coffea arabica]